jgi:hypothetical protein
MDWLARAQSVLDRAETEEDALREWAATDAGQREVAQAALGRQRFEALMQGQAQLMEQLQQGLSAQQCRERLRQLKPQRDGVLRKLCVSGPQWESWARGEPVALCKEHGSHWTATVTLLTRRMASEATETCKVTLRVPAEFVARLEDVEATDCEDRGGDGRLRARPPKGSKVELETRGSVLRAEVDGYGASEKLGDYIGLVLSGERVRLARDSVCLRRLLGSEEDAQSAPAALRAVPELKRLSSRLPGGLFLAEVHGVRVSARLVTQQAGQVQLELPLEQGSTRVQLRAQDVRLLPDAAPAFNSADTASQLRAPAVGDELTALLPRPRGSSAARVEVLEAGAAPLVRVLCEGSGKFYLRPKRLVRGGLDPVRSPEDVDEQLTAALLNAAWGGLRKGTTVVITPSAKRRKGVDDEMQQMLAASAAVNGRVARDVQKGEDEVPLVFDYPYERTRSTSVPLAWMGRRVLLDHDPALNHQHPPHARAAVEVLDGQHKGLSGICLREEDQDLWLVKLRADTVLEATVPTDHLWVKFPFAPNGEAEQACIKALDLF